MDFSPSLKPDAPPAFTAREACADNENTLDRRCDTTDHRSNEFVPLYSARDRTAGLTKSDTVTHPALATSGR